MCRVIDEDVITEAFKEWEMIAKSSTWSLSNENIPPALQLSYTLSSPFR